MRLAGRHLSISKRWLATALTLGAATAALGACGTLAAATPEQGVGNSVAGAFGQSSVSLELSVGLTAAQVTQLADAGSKGQPGISAADANALSTGALVVEIQSGHGEAVDSKQFTADKNNAYEFALQIGSAAPIELRYVDQTLYARADVAQLASELGLKPATATHFQADLNQANQYVPGLAALGQDQWVSVTQSALAPLESTLNQLKTANSPGLVAQVKGAFDHLFATVKSALRTNGTFTSEGVHNGQTEYGVSVAVLPFLKQVSAAVPSAVNAVPGLGAVSGSITKDLTKMEGRIPASQKFTFQLFESGNKVREIDVDLKQFKPSLPFSVPLRLQFGQPAAIAAPTGATPLNLSKLPSLIGQIMSSMLSGGLTQGQSASG